MIECARCILHEDIPGVVIGSDGECNYCKLHDQWELDNDTEHGKEWFASLISDMILDSKGKYDCIIGVSGGVDSSFLLMRVVDAGANPLAVHWNNNWNTRTATENIRKLVEHLGVDLYQVGIKPSGYNDLCRSFLLASTPDADIPNDIALTTVLYEACEIFDCGYLLNGHSFRTEGTTPLGWNYMDGGYIADVHNKFGSEPIADYPNLDYDLFKHYIELGIERIRPLWMLPYDKKRAIEELETRFGWRYYGAHHAENLYTQFVGAYLWREKFGMDLRYIEFSALIRSGFMTRENALREIAVPPYYPASLILKVRSRLGMSKKEWDEMMNAPVKSYRDYDTYQPIFREDHEYFKEALKRNLIPDTFYRKYVLGVQ